MKNWLFIIALISVQILSAQVKPTNPPSSQYMQNMGKAMQLWGEGKVTESCAILERIAAAEKDNWLPNYYIALENATSGFGVTDKAKLTALTTKAQTALDVELTKNPNNPELLVVQAMINTVWVVFDPMTNGQKLTPKIMAIYGKAIALAPDNPRVIMSKAEYEMGGAKFWGTDITPQCEEVKRADKLFDTEKVEIPFGPKWGKDRVAEVLKNCK